MSYTLQAVVVDKNVEEIASQLGLSIIEMPCELFMVLLTNDYVDSNGIPFLPLTDEGTLHIEHRLLDICLKLSSKGKAAYIEAEYFGGDGTQGSALFANREVIKPAEVKGNAINAALSWLGVLPDGTNDEFAVLGLNAHRKTEGWLNA